MVFITEDTWKNNGVEVINDDNLKWLNEKDIEKQINYSALRNITAPYPEYLRKERQGLLKDCLKQPCRRLLREDFGTQIIMDCRTIPVVKFRQRLGFNQYDVIMTQKQSVLTRLNKFFKTEDKIFQHYVLGYRVDMYVPEYKQAIKVDELMHCTRDLKSEIER